MSRFTCANGSILTLNTLSLRRVGLNRGLVYIADCLGLLSSEILEPEDSHPQPWEPLRSLREGRSCMLTLRYSLAST